MDFVRRVYVAGVGYTCYLTEVIKSSNGQEANVSKKEVSIVNSKSFSQTTENKKKINSKADSVDSVITYILNLKIGYSDIKSIDVTKYVVDPSKSLEILIVGKEILTTPGYQESLVESESTTGTVVSPIKAIIIIRGNDKNLVNSLAALIRNVRPYSVYKGIGLRLQGEPLNIKVVVKNKQKT